MLEKTEVLEVSLDHDLGREHRGTGYDILTWIEKAGAMRGYNPPDIRIHTANPAARKRMELALEAIRRLSSGIHPGVRPSAGR